MLDRMLACGLYAGIIGSGSIGIDAFNATFLHLVQGYGEPRGYNFQGVLLRSSQSRWQCKFSGKICGVSVINHNTLWSGMSSGK